MADIMADVSGGCYEVDAGMLSAAVNLRPPRRNNTNLARSLCQTTWAVSLIKGSILIASLIDRLYPKLDQKEVS